MDCCNYMQFKGNSYYSQYYENCSYPLGGVGGCFGANFGGGCDYYGQRYPDFYVNNASSYYGEIQTSSWPTSAAHFSGTLLIFQSNNFRNF